MISLGCFLLGFVAGLILASMVGFRMVKRIVQNHDQEMTHEWLQKRREAMDFGTPDELPLGVGPSVIVDQLWPERPGSLAAEQIRSEENDGKA